MLCVEDSGARNGLVGTDLVGVIQFLEGGILVGFQEFAWKVGWVDQHLREWVRGSGASHLPSPPNTYRLAETRWVGHQNPHRAHTACLPASSPPAPASGWALPSGPRTLGPAEKATHLAPPGGCAHFQVRKLSHQQSPGLRSLLAGVRATLQELEGQLGLPRRQSPALPTPHILTMRWSPGPHMTTSSNSNCLATSCMLWPKGVI